MTDFNDEYGVLSLNALRNSEEDSGIEVSDWISNSAAVLPNISVEPLIKKANDSSHARGTIRGIWGMLGCR